MTLAYPCGSNRITEVSESGQDFPIVVRGRCDCNNKNPRDGPLLVLKIEGGAMRQGTQETSRSWKRQETDSPPSVLEPLEGTQPCPLNLAQWDPSQASNLRNWKISNICYSKC